MKKSRNIVWSKLNLYVLIQWCDDSYQNFKNIREGSKLERILCESLGSTNHSASFFFSSGPLAKFPSFLIFTIQNQEKMELQINLVSVNHSGFNREIHRDNLLRGLTFQTLINGQPYEYRAKEVSSIGKVLFTKLIVILAIFLRTQQ